MKLNKQELEKAISHMRDREYMSGIDRERNRVKASGEVFTPTALVQEILDQLPADSFTDPTKTFLDPTCGDGQFLSEVVIRKLENGHSLEQALSTTFGVDLMPDNVALTRDRLLCGHQELRHLVERNIVCHDGLTYDYSFNGTDNNLNEVLKQTNFDGEITAPMIDKSTPANTATPMLTLFDTN